LNSRSSLWATSLRRWVARLPDLRCMPSRWNPGSVPFRCDYVVRGLHVLNIRVVDCWLLAMRRSMLDMRGVACWVCAMCRSVLRRVRVRCALFLSFLTASDTHERNAAN